ncbi:unnamed protein product [Onchocerca flexuosa]|uniref:Uncharacterized protein n=1 Tax=Onchocerca flexuosa TaxID=387005 RepID=A0A183HW50_9BILA|nr:unnamed protein product [Onchocerca flexuosa]
MMRGHQNPSKIDYSESMKFIHLFAFYKIFPKIPLSAQILSEPPVITANLCLIDCLKERSLLFAADDLRNFRKIILHIEEFCET